MSFSSQRAPQWGFMGVLGWGSKKGPTTNLLHPWPCFLVWVSDAGSLTLVPAAEAQVGVGLQERILHLLLCPGPPGFSPESSSLQGTHFWPPRNILWPRLTGPGNLEPFSGVKRNFQEFGPKMTHVGPPPCPPLPASILGAWRLPNSGSLSSSSDSILEPIMSPPWPQFPHL